MLTIPVQFGIRPERLQLEWIDAAEGARFAEVMAEMEDLRRQVSAEEIAETVRILNEKIEKKGGE